MNGLEILIEELKKELETRSLALSETILSDYNTYLKRFTEVQCYRAILADAKSLYIRLLDSAE